MKRAYYYAVIGLLFLLSFRLYSSLYYPLLNSDNGITILMIHYFQWPHDIYFWGQDRIGSLVPLIGQIFFRILHLSALTSEAVTHYLILLVGFLAFASFIRSHFLKIILAVIWFFPPFRLIDLTQLNFGIHYSVIAMACYLIRWCHSDEARKNTGLFHAVLILTTLVLIASIWASDMALVTVSTVLIAEFYYYREKKGSFRLIFPKPAPYYVLGGGLAGFMFIRFAKETAMTQFNYATFAGPYEILQMFSVFWNSMADLLFFRAGEPFSGVYTYLVIGVIALAVVAFRKVVMRDTSRKLFQVFLLDAVLMFIFIMISEWTFRNGVPRRYFTCVYVSASFVSILIFDQLALAKTHRRLLKAFLLITVVTGGLEPLNHFRNVDPMSFTPAVQTAGEFNRLGKIGVIASYWHAYLIACTDPDNIMAVPHDRESGRTPWMVGEVLSRQGLYVVRDRWMESFPDTLDQFGRRLIRDGSEFGIGRRHVCRYRVEP